MQLGRWGYYVMYVPSLIVLTIYMCTLGLITPFKMRMKNASLWGELMGRAWPRWACGIRVEITGEENIPDQPFVIIANHQSEWETLFLPRIMRPTAIVLKKSLTRIPVYGWSVLASHPIAIDRSSPKASIRDILVKGERRLREGSNVLIFAESTRVEPSTLRRYSRTGSKLAIQANALVLPVVHNAGDCWSPKRWFRPGTISLQIGKPIDSTGRDAAELTAEVESWARENYPGELAPAPN